MRSKIYCRSQKELANYLEELTTYFSRYGLIPDERRYIALPGEGVLRIRFDQDREGGTVSISLNWGMKGGVKNART